MKVRSAAVAKRTSKGRASITTSRQNNDRWVDETTGTGSHGRIAGEDGEHVGRDRGDGVGQRDLCVGSLKRSRRQVIHRVGLERPPRYAVEHDELVEVHNDIRT